MTQTIICIRCSYCLDGLPTTGLCPECGTPIERSMRGDLLAYCSSEYLRALHNGVFWVQASIIISILLVLLPIAMMATSFNIAAHAFWLSFPPLIMFANSAISIGGWWALSTADPGQLVTNKGETPRKIIRLAMLCSAVVAVIQFVSSFFNLPGPTSLFAMRNTASTQLAPSDAVDTGLAMLSGLVTLLSVIAWIAAFFAAMNYLRWLAPRIPNTKIFARATRLRWLAPVLYVFGYFCMGLGPLIAIVLYYNLLEWLRLDLRRIRAEVRASEVVRLTTS